MKKDSVKKPSGGSALKKLKSNLKNLGLIKTVKKGKKNAKKTLFTKSEKEEHVEKLNKLNSQVNPFEMKVNRKKHDILGKQTKGEVGLPTISRLKGIEKRNKTLLVEMKNKHKVGSFVDRRFGEDDPTLSFEEKMLERFAKEKKQKAEQGSIFNLESDQEELTHFGQSLSHDMEDRVSNMSEEDYSEMQTEAMNFGGFEKSKKSQDEIMKEVIALSKFHKKERQKEKEENEELVEELNEDFDAIRSLLFQEDTEVSGMEDKHGDYNKFVKDLAFDKRSKPSDRIKTAEEIIKAEAERLRNLEAERIKRMYGAEESEDESENSPEFSDNDESESPDCVYEEDNDEDDEDGNPEDGSGFGSESSFAEEEEQDEKNLSQVSDEEVTEEVQRSKIIDHVERKEISDTSQSCSIPYTFNMPESLEDLHSLLNEIKDEDQPVVIQRLRVLYHSSINESNKHKLEKLLIILLEHIEWLSIYKPHLDTFKMFSKSLMELSKQFPDSIEEFSKSKILQMNCTLSESIFSQTSENIIQFKDLVIIMHLGEIFSTSDFLHSVMTPIYLLLGKCLSSLSHRLRKISGDPNFHDIAGGLVICQILLAFQQESRRYIPEAILFLNTVINSFHENTDYSSGAPSTYLINHYRNGSLPDKTLCYKNAINIIKQFGELYEDKEKFKSSIGENCFSMTVPINSVFTDIEYPSWTWIEIFKPNKVIMKESLEKVESYRKEICQQFGFRRRAPLQWQKDKTKSIPTFIPKYEDGYNMDKHYDNDAERNERQKLRALHKKEMKGAIRELRRDASFISFEKSKKRLLDDLEYNKKIKRVYGILGEEAGEMNKQKRLKKRK